MSNNKPQDLAVFSEHACVIRFAAYGKRDETVSQWNKDYPALTKPNPPSMDTLTILPGVNFVTDGDCKRFGLESTKDGRILLADIGPMPLYMLKKYIEISANRGALKTWLAKETRSEVKGEIAARLTTIEPTAPSSTV